MIRVLVVDDSAVARAVFTRILSQDKDIVVVGAAANPYDARDLIVALRPDVLTLDMEMPRMDGLTFLRRMRGHLWLPTVVVSSVTERDSARAIEAFDAGAVEVLAKPERQANLALFSRALVQAVHAAACAHAPEPTSMSAEPARDRAQPSAAPGDDKLIALGASTGGLRALETVLSGLPRNGPPVVVAQHMPPGFTRALAERLAASCGLDVREATSEEVLRPGVVRVAPGGSHLVMYGTGPFTTAVKDGPRVNGHAPSIDVLFASCARAGPRVLAVLLTGMGRDGARGLLELRNKGATTLAQDEASSVVYGMPKVALELGAVDAPTPLSNMAARIAAWCAQPSA